MKLFSLVFFIIFLNACRSIPKCPECKVYTGNSNTSSIDRAQDDEKIYCNDEKIDRVKCFTDEGFEAFVETYINGCNSWGNKKRSLDFWKQNKKQLKGFPK